MKTDRFKIKLLATYVLCISCLFACGEKEEEYIPLEYSCLMINQGNYSQSNGSLTILTKQGKIENHVYEKANSWKIGAIIESAAFHKNMILLMCSSEDKIEFVDKDNFKILSAPVTGIGIPRYCAVYNDAAYITCVNNWNNPEGNVCKINLASKTLEKVIRTGGEPEGIREVNGLLYVAVGKGLVVIDPDTDEIVETIHIQENVTAKHIVEDQNSNLWVSFISENLTGIAAFDLQQKSFSPFIPLNHMALAGNIDITPDGKEILYLYAPEVVGAAAPDVKTAIFSFDIMSGAVQPLPVVSCVGMYGFNINPANGDIYTANISGFTANSITYRFDKYGNSLNEGWLTGTGTCRFYFP
jgi:hypothetical protein